MEQDNSPWQYKPDGAAAPTAANDTSDQPAVQPQAPVSNDVSWQATEFIEHKHPAGWYAALLAITVILAAAVYATTKDYFATATILIVGVIVGVFAGHKPGQVQYEISDSGLSVNGKIYPYSSFKSFAVFREGAYSSINLFPLKRFMPPISGYFAPEEEKKITDAIGNYLPYEDRKLDGVDRLSRRLRF